MKVELEGEQCCMSIFLMPSGRLEEYCKVYWFSFVLAGVSDGQKLRMCGRSSTVFPHSDESRQTPSLFLDQ